MGSGLLQQEYPLQRVLVRPATVDDAVRMSPLVRDEDMAEVAAATGSTVLQALLEGLRLSSSCYCLLKERFPVAVFGIAPVEPRPGYGAIWLLGTHEIKDIRWLFLRESRSWLRELEQGYDVIGNVVDARNELHIRWLKWLGFTFIREIPEFGKAKLPFHEFSKCVT
jgi:hypothetical protein